MVQWIRRIIAVGLALTLMGTMTSCDGAAAEALAENQARVPASSNDLEGENYQDVVDKLHDVGFAKIETKAAGDLITGWANKPEEVKEVEIGGVASFDEGDVFERDAAVVVSFHSFPDSEDAPTDSPGPAGGVDTEGALTFGDTGTFKVHFSSGDYPLDVKVSAPQAFTPSDTAAPSQTLDQQYAGIAPVWMPTNIYFDVTITNTSASDTYDQTIFMPNLSVVGTGDDDRTFSIDEGGWAYLNCPCNQNLGAGQSITLKQGWTVQNADKIEYVVEYKVLKTGYSETVTWTR